VDLGRETVRDLKKVKWADVRHSREGQHDVGGFFNPSFNGSPGVQAQVMHINS
jgi:hypothetical protein